jgi:hypothetical protein
LAVDHTPQFAGVGSPEDAEKANEAGACFLFEHDGIAWAPTGKLTAFDAAAFDHFGAAVAMHGDLLAVGAPQADAPASFSGAVYVYRHGAGNWQFEAKLTASDAAIGDLFGSSLCLLGSNLLVGAPRDTNPGGSQAGAAYLFTHNGAQWSQKQKLEAPDPQTGASLGTDVVLDPECVLLGAPGTRGATFGSGAAYLYEQIGGVFLFKQKLTASDGIALQEFGASVDLMQDRIVVGAPAKALAGNGSGAAYHYTYGASTWQESGKLVPAASQPDDQFGADCAIDRERIFVGSPGTDATPADAGAVTLFRRDGAGVYHEEATLDRSGSPGSRHGQAISLAPGGVLAAGDEPEVQAFFHEIGDFTLAMNPGFVQVGTTVDIHACGGAPGQFLTLFLTSAAQTPVFVRLPVVGVFDAEGEWGISGPLQSSPGAVELGFRVFALDPAGGFMASQQVLVDFL